MIQIYAIKTADLPSLSALRSFLKPSLLSAWQEKHSAVQNEIKARQSLAGLAMLQFAVGEGILSYDENDRPFLADRPEVDFNVTHTAYAVLCVVEVLSAVDQESGAQMPRVGLDAEDAKRLSVLQIPSLAERWFSERELAKLRSLSEPDLFLRIWTRKEALIKWTGEGMRALRRSDIYLADVTYGVAFSEYRFGEAVVALCYRQGKEVPSEITVLTGAQFETADQ